MKVAGGEERRNGKVKKERKSRERKISKERRGGRVL